MSVVTIEWWVKWSKESGSLYDKNTCVSGIQDWYDLPKKVRDYILSVR